MRFKTPFNTRTGTALKLCLVAEGIVDMYPRLGITSEWDIAAGHAIVKGANGNCHEIDAEFEIKRELCYNKENLKNPFFYCGPSFSAFERCDSKHHSIPEPVPHSNSA